MTERKRVMTDYRNDTEERELLEERRKLSLEEAVEYIGIHFSRDME